MIPENFIYFSLVLTQDSVERLENVILQNKTIQGIIQRKQVTGKFLHHCTLFYKNSCLYNQSVLTAEEIYNKIKEEFEREVGKIYKIKIIGWGWNNRALALLVGEKSIEQFPRLINYKYHITVCTFNGGRPVESNNISVWDMFETPIEVNCILTETILK